ncbi:RNA polymerase sigma factor [Tautonia plasticadhaerens]|uniref:RNA polymerase sigma factor n=1 Tax=Tautonia plasticadhaerens TaxID=2527974 RepID=A0A518HBZ0_9BACT|nr:sigma-70 family RNA polymerase sigma factor [Tautonia plasticadhaerens]QDV38383.1 ECF RNA polymerase sigma-E factor [Tautonia plasticadhaerens]
MASTGGPSPSQALAQQLSARDPDVQLMLQVRDDVQGAFEVLVRRYQDRLIGVLTHLVGDPGDAEDLAQEVFLRIYRARKGYKPQAKFSTWLFTIANNLALNHLRGKGRRPSGPLDPGTDSRPALPASERVAAPDGTPSGQLRQSELEGVVREAVGTLADDQRLAVLLNKFEDMSYAEIAAVMNRSEAAVKSLLARARMELRARLEPYLRSGDRAATS